MKASNLILITNHFPFGKGESFLEHEIPFLSSSFEKVVIISKNVTGEQTRKTPANISIERYNPSSSIFESVRDGLHMLLRLKLVISLLTKEKQYLSQQKKKGSGAFHFLFKAYQLSLKIDQAVKKHNLEGNICLYSYWLNSSALAITLCGKGNGISRAHGGDLYEYRNDNNYIPFRELLAEKLSRISPISLDGSNYLKSIVDKRYHHKIIPSNLGTPPPKRIPEKKSESTLQIVSCSNLVALKRIHLIIEALTTISDLKISWIHFGDGALREELSAEASHLLSTKTNIAFEFKGFVANTELLDFYATHYIDLFINTSEYEGVPVSMMEAQSFGIPIIGTDVGAVREIVTPQTGYLLTANPTPTGIGNAIRLVGEKTDTETAAFRMTCRTHWENNYNAEHNFSTFASDLKNLF